VTSGEAHVRHVITRYAAGGSEQRLRDVIAAVPDARHTVVVGDASDVASAVDALPSARIEHDRSLRRELAPHHDLRALARLVRSLRDERPAVLMTHQSKAGVLGRVAGRLTDVPVVHSLSMASFGPGYRSAEDRLFRLVERRLAPWTTAYAVVGDDLAEQYRQNGADAARVAVIRSSPRLPAPPTDRAAARRRLLDAIGVAEDRPVIAHVGSLDDRKGVSHLPQLLDRLGPTGARPVLVLAGDGPRRRDLEGLPDVHLLGHVADPTSVFQGADVVVLLSAVEGLPQVLVQAAAAGTPFVSFLVSGATELLALGAKGTAVPAGDLGAAASAIAAELAAPSDRERAVDLSSWDPEVVRGRYRDLLAPFLGEVEVRRAVA
jgi:glycosyltransferase involved in cell wall biosynthesis